MSILGGWLGNPSPMTGPERKALRDAILAGAERDSLRMALSDSVDSRDYEELVRSADFRTEVDELIGKALKQGWLDDLIAAFVAQTEREDLIAQARAVGARVAERQAAQGGAVEDSGIRPRRWWAALAAVAAVLLAALAFYLSSPRDPNFIVRLFENKAPASERSVFVAKVGHKKRYSETTNSHGEAYFHLKLGSGSLYEFGVQTGPSTQCTFPAFAADNTRTVVYELSPKSCLLNSRGLQLQTKAVSEPVDVPGLRGSLPTDLATRLGRAPLGVPKAPLVLDRRYYSLGFDPAIRSPRWVSFTVDTNRAMRLRRLQNVFTFDPAIPEESQTGEDAYRNNRYDRGQMIQRGDALIGANEAEARASEAEVYYYSVTVPQAAATNQRTWSGVERYATNLSARIGPIHVVAGPVYPDLSKGNEAYLTLGQSRTVVPISLYRILLRRTADGQWRAIAFLVPNDGSSERNPKVFATSVAAVEKVTGLTFFPNLPPETAAALKANDSLEAFER